jgi:hypothetical protein
MIFRYISHQFVCQQRAAGDAAMAASMLRWQNWQQHITWWALAQKLITVQCIFNNRLNYAWHFLVGCTLFGSLSSLFSCVRVGRAELTKISRAKDSWMMQNTVICARLLSASNAPTCIARPASSRLAIDSAQNNLKLLPSYATEMYTCWIL